MPVLWSVPKLKGFQPAVKCAARGGSKSKHSSSQASFSRDRMVGIAGRVNAVRFLRERHRCVMHCVNNALKNAGFKGCNPRDGITIQAMHTDHRTMLDTQESKEPILRQ